MGTPPVINTKEGNGTMSGTTAVAFVATVLILSCLAGFIAWLNRGNQARSQNCNQTCVHTHPHSHIDYLYYYGTDWARIGHDHDHLYAPLVHDHDDQYSVIGHHHDGLYALVDHSHNEYATRVEMDRRLTQLQRRFSVMNTAFAQSPLGILLGILFGGVIGALVGVILDFVLPRSIFEVDATTTYTVGGQQIVQHLTSYDTWPKWGIVLGCIVVGMLLGGLIMFAVGLLRSRRQSNNQVEEA